MAIWSSFSESVDDKGGNKAELGVLRSRSASAVVTSVIPESASHSRDGGSPYKNYSMPNVDFDCRSCRELKLFNFPLSMVRDCDQPKEQLESHQIDFCMQVTATDIQSGSSAQTSQSLLEYVNSQEADDLSTDLQASVSPLLAPILPHPTPELPKRCPNPLRILAASKCHGCRDCEENRVVPTGQYQNDETQTESWWITWHELSQTGPSLTAAGPFCRFDYKLRKSRSDKTHVLCDCPVRPGPLVVCSRNRDACSDFQQQVSSLKISVTEMEQTEQAGDIEKAYLRVLYSYYRPKDSETVGKVPISPLDFDSPYTWEEKYGFESTRCFEMQVSQNDICATKLIQTDRCLLKPYACRKSRKFYKLWGKESTIPKESQPQNLATSLVETGQQVQATDIGDTNETQTCQTLSKMKPFRAATSTHGSHGKEKKPEKVGRTRDMQIDTFGPCCPATETATFADASNQINQSELGTSTGVQTCAQTPNLNKSYICRHKQACRSWC